MSTDLISVIIPSYKPDNYIYRCLESVARQDIDKQRYEVIIVLNGCNEPYHTDIKLFLQQKFQGIKTLLLQTDDAGVSNARNIGLDNAQGKYIAFIDDDDWVSDNYLTELFSHANENDIVVSNVIQNNEQTDKEEEYFLTNAYYRNKNKSNISLLSVRSFLSNVCEKLIPIRVIGKERFSTDYHLGEDSLFMFTISKRIGKVILSSTDTLYYVNKRKNSASHRHHRYKDRLVLAIRLTSTYTRTYIKEIRQYNFLFYATRIMATLRKLFLRNYE